MFLTNLASDGSRIFAFRLPSFACFRCDQRSLGLSQFFRSPVNFQGFYRFAFHNSFELFCVFSRALNSIPVFEPWSIRGVFFCPRPLPLWRAAFAFLAAVISGARDYSTTSFPFAAGPGFFAGQPTSGSARWRLPVSVNSAFATAGASGGTPGSPTPPGSRWLATTQVSTTGAEASRTIG